MNSIGMVSVPALAEFQALPSLGVFALPARSVYLLSQLGTPHGGREAYSGALG